MNYLEIINLSMRLSRNASVKQEAKFISIIVENVIVNISLFNYNDEGQK